MFSIADFPEVEFIPKYTVSCHGKIRFYLIISLALHGLIFFSLIKILAFPVPSTTRPVDIEMVSVIEDPPLPEEAMPPEETAERPTPDPPLPPSAPPPPPPPLASVVEAPPLEPPPLEAPSLEPPPKPQPPITQPSRLNRPPKIHHRVERPVEPPKPSLQDQPAASLPTSTMASPVVVPPVAAPVPGPRLATSETIQDYGRRLWMRIVRHKPETIVARGSTALNFAVSPEGELISVTVTKTSGNATLDSASIAAVRAATPLPVPPPGARPSDLVFSIAFDYH